MSTWYLTFVIFKIEFYFKNIVHKRLRFFRFQTLKNNFNMIIKLKEWRSRHPQRWAGGTKVPSVEDWEIDGCRGFEGGMESWSSCWSLGWHWEDWMIQILCESSDYTVVYIHIHIHCKHTNSNGIWKIVKLKKDFLSHKHFENCTLCDVEKISKIKQSIPCEVWVTTKL